MKTSQNLPLSGFTVLGHRGAISDHFGFHQNSMRAFEEAVTEGDGFETDACVDKDGEIFLIHEAKYVDPAKGVEYCATEHLDNASAALIGERRIDQLTTEEMRRLRLKDGSPIPTLKKAIALVGSKTGKLLNIELKAYEVADHVLRLLKQSLDAGVITSQSLMVSSFNLPALVGVREKAPELTVGAIFNYPHIRAASLFPWVPESAGAYMPLTDEVVSSDVLKCVQPDVFVMPEEILTEANVAMIAAHYPKAECSAWVFTERGTCDLPDLLRRLKILQPTGKVASIMVDNPHEFVKAYSAA